MRPLYRWRQPRREGAQVLPCPPCAQLFVPSSAHLHRTFMATRALSPRERRRPLSVEKVPRRAISTASRPRNDDEDLEMLETYPATINLDRQLLARVIETLVACSQACTTCADACLSEEMVADLLKCASGPTSTAPTGLARPRRGSCPATPVTTPTSPGPTSRPASPPAGRVVMSASNAGMHEHCRVCRRAMPGLRGAACAELLAAIR